MFLDEELTQIWENNSNIPLEEKVEMLILACHSRFGDVNKCGIHAWVQNVKRAEFSWRLFAKKHKEIKEDGLRNVITKMLEDDSIKTNTFGWEKIKK